MGAGELRYGGMCTVGVTYNSLHGAKRYREPAVGLIRRFWLV